MITNSTSTTSTKLKELPDGSSVTKNFKLSYDSGELKVFEQTINENEEVTEVLIIVQPWKCLPDGSRESFSDHEDAFQWFEDSKSWLV